MPPSDVDREGIPIGVVPGVSGERGLDTRDDGNNGGRATLRELLHRLIESDGFLSYLVSEIRGFGSKCRHLRVNGFPIFRPGLRLRVRLMQFLCARQDRATQIVVLAHQTCPLHVLLTDPEAESVVPLIIFITGAAGEHDGDLALAHVPAQPRFGDVLVAHAKHLELIFTVLNTVKINTVTLSGAYGPAHGETATARHRPVTSRVGTPPGRHHADLGAVAGAVAAAVRTVMQEAKIPTPAPPPRKPGDSDDTHSGSEAGYRNRADVLLGSFARTAPRSYSLSDLASGEGGGLDHLTSGAQLYIRR